MIRVNDRVVHNNRAGTVTELDHDDWPRVRFDDDGCIELCHPDSVVIVSTIPVRVTFAHNVGDRVRFKDYVDDKAITTFITERVESDDAPTYKLLDSRLNGLYAEDQITAAPLPEMHDDDIEDLIAMYLRRGVQYMRDEADRREFDLRSPKLEVIASGDNTSSIEIKFSAKWSYGVNEASGDTAKKAINESIRRQQADKDNQPKKLPYSG